MATPENIKSCLSALNITLSDNASAEKCVKLCLDYNIDAEDFADEWVSFIISHENGRLLPPNRDLLEKMERKVLKKTEKSAPKPVTPVNEVQVEKVLVPEPEAENFVSFSQRFKDRTDSGSVLHKFGNAQSTFTCSPIEFSLKFVEEMGNFRYMYEKMGEKAKCLDNLTNWGAVKIMGQPPDSIKYGQTGRMTVAGRIYPETLEERLSHQNVVFESSLDNYGRSVLLHLDKVKKYSLFPGQVAVVRGTNEKKKFIVDEIHTKIPAKLPETPPDFAGNFQIVVACGPFTFSDNLLNEPLWALTEYVREKRPHLLILVGPFLDKNQKCFETVDATFQQVFEDLIDSLMARLGPTVQAVVIPSEGELHHHQVYPTPPFKLRTTHENLHLSANPSQVDVGNFLIAASSPDILLHIANQVLFRDLTATSFPDRIKRSISHILDQRSFYPLFPPSEHISIDYQLLERCGVMETVPNLLILPSNMTCYIHEINGCVVINPGKLSKGTFARIELATGSGAVARRINAQILKI